jgi:hypothetical protein
MAEEYDPQMDADKEDERQEEVKVKGQMPRPLFLIL